MASFLPQREFKQDKHANFSEWYNTVIYAADLVDGRYNVQGFLVHKPWGTAIINSLYGLFEAGLEADGHRKVIFPTVIPEENFEREKEHVKGFVPQVFWVTKGGGESFSRPLALRPTSETAFYQMFALWVQAHTDLPLKLYQSCSVFRFEHETLPFIRGREFLWIETHDCFATRAEAVEQTRKDNEISRTALTKHLGIPLMVFERPQWDKFPGAESTFAYDVLMPDGKALQVGSTHLLGQNFTKAFGVQFTKADGSKENPYSTCFGPGIWRMVAALAGVHGDEKGLVLPFETAPAQVVVVPIAKGDGEKIVGEAEKIAKELVAQGLRVECDASDKSPGWKFNYWELKGVPLRVELGERELASESVTVVRRDNREKKTVKRKELLAAIKEVADKMLADLRAKAEKELKESISEAKTREEVKKVLERTGGFARTSFCSIGAEGEECGKELQAFTGGGKVRGVLADKQEKPAAGAKCVVCGKKAGAVVYVAKQY